MLQFKGYNVKFSCPYLNSVTRYKYSHLVTTFSVFCRFCYKINEQGQVFFPNADN